MSSCHRDRDRGDLVSRRVLDVNPSRSGSHWDVADLRATVGVIRHTFLFDQYHDDEDYAHERHRFRHQVCLRLCRPRSWDCESARNGVRLLTSPLCLTGSGPLFGPDDIYAGCCERARGLFVAVEELRDARFGESVSYPRHAQHTGAVARLPPLARPLFSLAPLRRLLFSPLALLVLTDKSPIGQHAGVSPP